METDLNARLIVGKRRHLSVNCHFIMVTSIPMQTSCKFYQ